MKLYDKKLKSLADLKREKEILKYAQKHTHDDAKEAFSHIGKRSKSDNASNVNLFSSLAKLATSGSVVDVLMSLGGPIISTIGRKGGKTLKKAAWEAFGGYFKWKLIEIGINVARQLLKNKKTNDTNKKRT